jgi:phosphatidylglycerophosphatase A
MSANPDAAIPTEAADSQVALRAETKRKPRFALFIATAGGLGNIPVAPGTWGSVAGVVIAFVLSQFVQILLLPFVINSTHFDGVGLDLPRVVGRYPFNPNLVPLILGFFLIATVGVWASDHVAKFSNTKDPQFVVIDEVSGQHLTLLLGCLLPASQMSRGMFWFSASSDTIVWPNPLKWKYLLLGFILFRIFDIWKPFPARQAESLPGGWGIMADDWVAGLYAAIGLWIARAAGL